MKKTYRKLKELCEITGATRRAIQMYEAADLIKPSKKNKQGYLLYEDSVIRTVWLIKLYQKAGFRLKEIKILMYASNEELKYTLENRIIELEREAVEMDKVIEQLRDIITEL